MDAPLTPLLDTMEIDFAAELFASCNINNFSESLIDSPVISKMFNFEELNVCDDFSFTDPCTVTNGAIKSSLGTMVQPPIIIGITAMTPELLTDKNISYKSADQINMIAYEPSIANPEAIPTTTLTAIQTCELPLEQERFPYAHYCWNGFTPADIGIRVTVDDGAHSEGVIKFVGLHHHDNFPRIGVQLNEPRGLNNGTVRGHFYFTAPDQHGLFADPRKVQRLNAVDYNYANITVATNTTETLDIANGPTKEMQVVQIIHTHDCIDSTVKHFFSALLLPYAIIAFF